MGLRALLDCAETSLNCIANRGLMIVIIRTNEKHFATSATNQFSITVSDLRFRQLAITNQILTLAMADMIYGFVMIMVG